MHTIHSFKNGLYFYQFKVIFIESQAVPVPHRYP
uniref:Uncharacterized protein n=1 Tax=Anguilla anguilla TaxID=7936 RepID=A0A0E9V725_ANGAN